MQLIFVMKNDYLGCAVLFCLNCCLFDLPSHLSFKYVYKPTSPSTILFSRLPTSDSCKLSVSETASGPLLVALLLCVCAACNVVLPVEWGEREKPLSLPERELLLVVCEGEVSCAEVTVVMGGLVLSEVVGEEGGREGDERGSSESMSPSGVLPVGND